MMDRIVFIGVQGLELGTAQLAIEFRAGRLANLWSRNSGVTFPAGRCPTVDVIFFSNAAGRQTRLAPRF
jgi:hypothetical protein